MTKPRDSVGMYEMLDALEAVIHASDPAKRERLAQAIDHYREDFPDEFHWATGVSAPFLLANVMMAIDASCRAAFEAKARPTTGIAERKRD